MSRRRRVEGKRGDAGLDEFTKEKQGREGRRKDSERREREREREREKEREREREERERERRRERVGGESERGEGRDGERVGR